MALMAGAERETAAALRERQQAAWARQSAYVAERSAFYARLWDGAPPPARLEALAELPLSDKAMLRAAQAAHPPFGDYLAADRATVTRLHRTSGSTGQAMNLALSARDCEITEVVGGRCQTAAGLTPSHTVVHCLNYRMWMGGVTDHLTLERTGATVVPFGVGETALLVRAIREIGVDAISCTPSYPAVLERAVREAGLEPRALGLKLGLFGGEPGLDDPAFRGRIETVWGMSARNANYGVSDVFSNFAAQCGLDSRLHFLAADVLWPELIEPESGAPVPLRAGATGELTLTHLARDCQPLVRFRTGDIVAIDEDAPCGCGGTGFRFRVVGRSDDMVVVRGLNLFPSMIAAEVAATPELSGEYRIVLTAPPPYDALPLEVEAAEGVAPTPALAEALAARIKSNLGASARVAVLPFGALPRTEGKTRRVLRSPA